MEKCLSNNFLNFLLFDFIFLFICTKVVLVEKYFILNSKYEEEETFFSLSPLSLFFLYNYVFISLFSFVCYLTLVTLSFKRRKKKTK